MQIDSHNPLDRLMDGQVQDPRARALVDGPGGEADNFAAHLKKYTPEQIEEARDAAAQWVGVAFFQPLLDQMQNDPLRTDLFHGGYGERVWSQELNTILRERMAEASSFELAEVIVDRLMGPQAAGHPAREPDEAAGKLEVTLG